MTEQKTYNLESRTRDFAIKVIRFCKKVPRNVITIPIISQLVRAVTSIGANYHEANGASSKKDFRNKIFICKKEAKESEYWLDILLEAICEHPELIEEEKLLQEEAKELILIFSSIASKSC